MNINMLRAINFKKKDLTDKDRISTMKYLDEILKGSYAILLFGGIQKSKNEEVRMERVECPRCSGVCYTACPSVESKCPYCGHLFADGIKNGGTLRRISGLEDLNRLDEKGK